MQKKIVLVGICGGIVLVGVLSLLLVQDVGRSRGGADAARSCTAEVLLCPDGSSVGRAGMSCSFSPCPDQSSYTGELIEHGGAFALVLPAPQGVAAGVTYALPLEQVDAALARSLVGRQVRVSGVFQVGNRLRVTAFEAAADQPTEAGAALGTLRVGETRLVSGVRITFEEVVQDSRCPSDVRCVVAGSVRVRVLLESDTDRVVDMLGSDESPYAFDSFQVSIVDVAPARGMLAQQIDPADYRVTFRVEPLQAPSSIERYLREHIGELSPAHPVLGGTFYVTAVRVTGDTTAVVEYEDGHIVLVADVKFSTLSNGDVVVDSFMVRKQL